MWAVGMLGSLLGGVCLNSRKRGAKRTHFPSGGSRESLSPYHSLDISRKLLGLLTHRCPSSCLVVLLLDASLLINNSQNTNVSEG